MILLLTSSNKPNGQRTPNQIHYSCISFYYFQGDLGTITDKYDVAISTACGALDNVVVDNMETAVKCVQFLKENNIGTATFIGLEKVHVNV